MAGEAKVSRAEERARNSRRRRTPREAEEEEDAQARASAAGAHKSRLGSEDSMPPAASAEEGPADGASEVDVSRTPRRAAVPMIGEDIASEEDNSEEEVGAVVEISNGKALTAGDVLQIYAAEEQFRETLEETFGNVSRDAVA